MALDVTSREGLLDTMTFLIGILIILCSLVYGATPLVMNMGIILVLLSMPQTPYVALPVSMPFQAPRYHRCFGQNPDIP